MKSIPEEIPDIPLKENMIKDYYEKQLNPMKTAKNAMRRLKCSVERMDFQEICYSMGENFVNKRKSNLGMNCL